MGNLSSKDRRRAACRVAVWLASALLAAAAAGAAVFAATAMPRVALRCAVVSAACTAAAGALTLALARRERAHVAADLADLARRVDCIVRDPSSVQDFSSYEEGELAILANELHKACALLRDQAAELRRDRDRLASSLADISHQLRTPLMSVNLSLELLGDPALPAARRQALLRELQAQADHMAWLVSALLALARADAGTLQLKRVSVDVGRLISQVVDALGVAAELRGVDLQTAPLPEGAAFEGDPGWSKEALANVVKNCIDHTPPGGSVRIEATQDALAARIVVADTGPGIAARDLPHLFERFYRGEGSAPGSAGIGLALARGLTVAQGGTLVALNLPAGGACFVFSFPSTVV